MKFMKGLSMVLAYLFAWFAVTGFNELILRNNPGALLVSIIALALSVLFSYLVEKKANFKPLGIVSILRGIPNIVAYFQFPAPILLMSGAAFLLIGFFATDIPTMIKKRNRSE